MKINAIILGVLLAPALFAADLDTLLDTAAQVKPGDHKAWLEARASITELGEDALPGLTAAGAEGNWTAEGWVRALVAETCRVRIAKPDVAKAVDNPMGIDPAVYKLYRKPEPACQHHLKNLGTDGTPLLLERLRWTLEAYTYSKGEDGQLERDCYARALLFAPGFNADTRARFAMEAAVRDLKLTDSWRQTAAVSLGQTGGVDALSTLTELFDSDTQNTAVREACAWALGRVASIKPANEIKTRLAKDGLSPELQRALLTGVGILGSAWTWKSRGPMQAAAGDEVRESCARMLIEAIKTMPTEIEFISRALSMTAYAASLAWVRELSTEGETEAIRAAATQCIDPLKTAINRAG